MSNYYEPKDISRKIRMEFLSAFAETKKLTRAGDGRNTDLAHGDVAAVADIREGRPDQSP